jgi:dynein heavy chain 1
VALDKNEKKNGILTNLTTCDFQSKEFKKNLEELQSITDDFIFNDYSNIFKWVNIVNDEIEKLLVKRVEDTIEEWVNEFDNYGDATPKYITMTPIHEIKIRDQQLVMDPSVQEMRSYWYKQLNNIVSLICSQKKIESMKYEKGGRSKNSLVDDDVEKVPTFKTALKRISVAVMFKANQRIEAAIGNASSYVSISGCQALWNVDFTKLYDKLEGNVAKWHFCLGGLKNLIKRNFDSAETIKHFGAVVIDYQKAQDQVNNRFKALQESIIKKLYEDLHTNLKIFHGTLTKAKNDLEVLNIHDPNIDVTLFITEIQEKNRLSSKWEKELEDVFKQGVQLLKKNYPIQTEFALNIDNVNGAWNTFKQVLQKKIKLMDDQMDKLRENVLLEEKEASKKIEEAKKEWVAMKEQGFIRKEEGQEAQDENLINVQDILNFLTIMQGKATKLKDDWGRVCKAKELLDMDLPDPEALDGFEETIRDHKDVWAALSKIWAQVMEVGETFFAALNPKKIKESLRNIFEEFLEMPTKFKQYDAYEDMRARVSKFQGMQNMIIDLKGEAMKQRHWVKLLRQLRIKIPFNDLTIMDLWAADLVVNKVAVNDIMASAIGENAIERFLTDVKDHWSTHELDLVKYVS